MPHALARQVQGCFGLRVAGPDQAFHDMGITSRLLLSDRQQTPGQVRVFILPGAGHGVVSAHGSNGQCRSPGGIIQDQGNAGVHAVGAQHIAKQ
ncbi:hypothetical protein D3C81_1614520 [compost metagenome]